MRFLWLMVLMCIIIQYIPIQSRHCHAVERATACPLDAFPRGTGEVDVVYPGSMEAFKLEFEGLPQSDYCSWGGGRHITPPSVFADTLHLIISLYSTAVLLVVEKQHDHAPSRVHSHVCPIRTVALYAHTHIYICIYP